MGSDLRAETADGSAVKSAEFVVASARLTELHECSATLRRTRARAEEIVDEARGWLEEARAYGATERVRILTDYLEQVQARYTIVLTAYVVLSRKIAEERQEIIEGLLDYGRTSGLSGIS